MDKKKLNDALKEKTKVQVINFLMRGNKTYSEIMSCLDEKDSGRVNYHLKLLTSLNLIRKEDSGEYSLTTEGEKFGMYAKQFELKEQYPIPVVCCEVEHEGKILFAKRAKKPYLNYWLIPGGKVGHGESFFEASERELMEECGMKIKPKKVKGIYPTIIKDNLGNIKHHVYLIHMLCDFVEKLPHLIEKDSDVSEYGWFNREGLSELKMIPSNKIFYNQLPGQIHEQVLIEEDYDL
ncbi:NUDIX domain-containing protein [Candidatus Woesearchaeota archaeon]|jgi:8-oxo-dGTP diphosphatase|nr:NUDIX domain-containing protein [Candidatus Woesearchaeota archaeon]MBT4336424.1 NUDIX domain-containing protein [Candidatus Woesearchaeota archaeon]MBT4469921.1 NUDIX domain-containing protein [Candidatus Woesearchaeota archaeon]MBT6744355.1 NUDIX domain-containing protein [Candidatus Woesearchaeota archaeon]